MAGENYKEFDSASIITGTSKDTVSIAGRTFRKRDVLLGGIAIIALIGCIILAILLAVTASDNKSDCSKQTDGSKQQQQQQQEQQEQQEQTGKDCPTCGAQYCSSAVCLKTSAYEKSCMDEKVDPCENFYQYACGNYKNEFPQDPILVDVSPVNMILKENVEKLDYMLIHPVKKTHEFSYERKLKHFIESCSNHFDKMHLRGTPFLNQIIDKIGGWYLLDTFDITTFDINDQLKKTHLDFWTTAFFNVFVSRDQWNWNRNIVELSFGGIGLPYDYYMQELWAEDVQTEYKHYMRTLATTLVSDAGKNPDMNKVQTFVNDAYDLESRLAEGLLMAHAPYDPHNEMNRVPLKNLTLMLQNTIDFTEYLQAMFDKVTGVNALTEDSTVALLVNGYFEHVGSVLGPLLSSQDGKRKIHNYLVWQLLSRYAPNLSWDYIHAKRRLNYMVYGNMDTSSGYLDCFTVAENYMSDALNAVYVNTYMKKENKEEGKKIIDDLKVEMLKSLEKLPWLSNADRDTSIKKIQDGLYKIGYDEKFLDHDQMDNIYYQINIDVGDYFGNILNLNKVHRAQFNHALQNMNDRSTWPYHSFVPVITYYNPWHLLLATSAVLQSPLFRHNGPKYVNYGGVGSIAAKNLVHAVDELGGQHKLDGSHFGLWWGNSTSNRYMKIKQCAIDAQKNKIVGPFKDLAGNSASVNMTMFGGFWAPDLLAESSGIRLSLRAYKTRLAGKPELLTAGFEHKTAEKMFFVSYAQSLCQNTPDFLKLGRAQLLELPSQFRVNMALSHVKEFHAAFNCPVGAKLRPQNTCTLI